MIKKIIQYIVIVCFSFSYSYAEVIKDIKISGNKRISNETILVLGETSISKNYESTDLNNTLKKLYETNFFKDINISFENGVLAISVIENPIIEDIEITGIKSKSFIEDISNEITLKDRMSFTENQLNKDIDKIKNILKVNGFYFAKVNSSINKNDDLNSVRLKINIEQGSKAKIKEIVFLGNKKIKDKKLLEVIASEEHKFWKFVSNKVYLNKSLIDLDKRLLENYYRNQGYYKAQVKNSFAELNDDESSFKLVFNIDAGSKYFFNKLTLDLPDDYNINDFDKVEKIFSKISKKEFSLDKVNLILDEIDNIASLRLYDFITAEVEEKVVEKNKINFNFKIVDSEKFYVERINILGNFQTIEEVIRNKLIVDEGDPLNELLFNKSIDRVKSLGIFKSVKTEIKNGSDKNLKVIDLNVVEKPTGEISLGAGVGSSGSTIGGGIKEKNFLGKGINLSTNLEVSEESVKGRFVYAKPNFNYTDNTLFTSVESTTTDNLSDFGYKVSNVGFSFGTTFEQFENLYFSPEVNLSIEDLKTNTNASSNLKKQEGTYEDFYFNYGLNYDLRNSSFRPSKGNKTTFFQEVPIVSGNNEISNTFIFTQYKKLSKTNDMIGKASLYLKAINTLGDSDVRISKRAYVPYQRLRGFEKGKVGPVDSNDDYIGGNYITTLNLSTNIPTILSTVENIDFSYFIDFGNVWGVDYDKSINDSSALRSSTGVALDILTAVGPLSFSLTQPLEKKSTDKTEKFRFNLGTTF
ncbi:outer membrane protein assembly factor BamA [Pelagibacterales bacterium SAG-MED19]|nr:outer membrane protein assembly factor BamA [Pelagibacterales bacterium SAG-MED19]